MGKSRAAQHPCTRYSHGILYIYYRPTGFHATAHLAPCGRDCLLN